MERRAKASEVFTFRKKNKTENNSLPVVKRIEESMKGAAAFFLFDSVTTSSTETTLSSRAMGDEYKECHSYNNWQERA